MTVFEWIGIVIAGLIVVRSGLLLFFAESGRKQDLIRQPHKSADTFYLAILIPYLDSSKIGPLQDLIQALARQDYPQDRIGIHIVATEETAFGLPHHEDLPPNVRLWTHPERKIPQGEALNWLIERLLASGGPTRLFAFLEADDIVRPDFIKNITIKAYNSFVLQGYSAFKRPPKGLWGNVCALSARLQNRIENAGRFHLGLSSILQRSGWVIRQEILEMIPFKSTTDLENIEYTALLALNGYRVHWAPNVVVYKHEKADLFAQLNLIVQTVFNRLKVGFWYAPPLLLQGVTRLNLSQLEIAWTMIKPPYFVLGLLSVAILWGQSQSALPIEASGYPIWATIILAFWATQLLVPAVARCTFKDLLCYLLATPIAYAAGLALFPFSVVSNLFFALFDRLQPRTDNRVGRRFDETLPAKQIIVPERAPAKTRSTLPGKRLSKLAQAFKNLEEQAHSISSEEKSDVKPSFQPVLEDHEPLFDFDFSFQPESTFEELPISNGNITVYCNVETQTLPGMNGQNQYSLVLSYKSLRFETPLYPRLEEAYAELEGRLEAKGFTLSRHSVIS